MRQRKLLVLAIAAVTGALTLPAHSQDLIKTISDKGEQEVDDYVEEKTNVIPLLKLIPIPTERALPVIITRGFTSFDAQATKSNSISITQDDVFLGYTAGFSNDIVELEDVEFTRGPYSGWGRNALAGNVNYVTVKPSDKAYIKQKLSYGSFEEAQSKTTINAPISDTLMTRMTLGAGHKEGTVESTNSESVDDFGARDTLSGSVAVRWLATDDLTVDYSYDVSKASFTPLALQLVSTDNACLEDSANCIPNTNNNNFGQHSEVSGDRKDKTPLYVDERSHALTQGHRVGFEYEINEDHHLKTITSYRRINSDYTNQLGTTGFSSFQPEFVDIDDPLYTDNNYDPAKTVDKLDGKQWSHEFRFSGDINDRLSYIAGAYYYHEENDGQMNRFDNRQMLSSMDFVQAAGTPINPLGAFINGTLEAWYQTQGNAKIDNYALYSKFDYIPNLLDDKLTISVGLRQEWVKTSAKKTFNGGCNFNNVGVANPTNPAGYLVAGILCPGGVSNTDLALVDNLLEGALASNLPPGIPVPDLPEVNINAYSPNDLNGQYHADNRTQQLLPSLQVAYQHTDDQRYYASIRQGWRPGGFSAFASPQTFETGFKDESMWTYELGFSGAFINRALQLNSSIYYNDISDHQKNAGNRTHPGMIDTYNVQKMHSYGADIDAIMILSRHLLVKLSYSYLHSEYDEYTRLDEINSKLTDVPGLGGLVQPTFNEITGIGPKAPGAIDNAPKHSGSAGIVYRFDETAYGEPSVMLSTIYRSSQFSRDNGEDPAESPGFAVWNVEAKLAEMDVFGGNMELRLWSKNIFDRSFEYARVTIGEGGGYSTGLSMAAFGDPRTFGLDMRYHYE